MPLDIINNGETGASVRTKLNLVVAQVNTSVDDIDAVEADVATLQGEMVTAQADILLRQLANARSTLNYNYRGTASATITCLNTDYNTIIASVNAAPTTFTLPSPATLPAFVIGNCVIIYNSPDSSDAITITPSGGTYKGSTNVAIGEAAHIVMTTATQWDRICFTK